MHHKGRNINDLMPYMSVPEILTMTYYLESMDRTSMCSSYMPHPWYNSHSHTGNSTVTLESKEDEESKDGDGDTAMKNSGQSTPRRRRRRSMLSPPPPQTVGKGAVSRQNYAEFDSSQQNLMDTLNAVIDNDLKSPDSVIEEIVGPLHLFHLLTVFGSEAVNTMQAETNNKGLLHARIEGTHQELLHRGGVKFSLNSANKINQVSCLSL